MTSQGSCVGEVGLPISRNKISEAPSASWSEMKDLLPRQEASRVLEDAINVAYERGFISGAAPQLHVSVPSCSETVNSVVLGCSGSFQLFDVNISTARLGLYPLLCKLARLRLSASASSAPVECMFSSAGIVANWSRSSLSADRLHRVCFVHDNFKLAF